jgi:hypothetical protein
LLSIALPLAVLIYFSEEAAARKRKGSESLAHITAHKGSATNQDGNTASCGNSSCSTYLIRNSRLPAASRHKKTADLGRAWRGRATVVYESTWMDSHIIPVGWGTAMHGCKPTSTTCPNVSEKAVLLICFGRI